jgi:hypothetical protein
LACLAERLQNPDVLQPDPIPDLKRQLAATLVDSLRGWSGTESLYMIGIDPHRLSDLRHGRLRRFSLEKLIQILVRCGLTVSITVERDGP